MKAMVTTLAVAILAEFAFAQSSAMQPPPLLTPSRSKRINPVRNGRESSFPVPDASKLTTQLDDAIRSQVKPAAAFGIDRSKIRLAGGEEDAGSVEPAQFMPNQRFPRRGVDGLLSTRGRSDSKDPTAGTGQRMTPVPRPDSNINQRDSQPFDFGSPSNTTDPKPKKLDFGKPFGASAYDPPAADSADSLYSNNKDADASNFDRLAIPQSNKSRSTETFLPANSPKKSMDSGYADRDVNFGDSTAVNSPHSQPERRNSPSVYGDTPTHSDFPSRPNGTDAGRGANVSSVAKDPSWPTDSVYGAGYQERNQASTQQNAIGSSAIRRPPRQTQLRDESRTTQTENMVSGRQYDATAYPQSPISRPKEVVQTVPRGSSSPSFSPAIESRTFPPAATTTPQIAAPEIRTQVPGIASQYETAQANQSNFPNPQADSGIQPTDTSPSTIVDNSPPYPDTTYAQGQFSRGSNFMTLLALFASIGLNIYLGWIAYDTYNRYQDLVADMRRTPNRRRERPDRRDRRLAESGAY